MNKNWLSITLLLTIIIGGFVLAGTARFGMAQAEGWSLSKVPIPNGASVAALDMVSATDGWAVGSDGCILHWDGTSWSNVTSPTTVWLKCVDMVSSTEGWIVGADGIYHWQENASEFPTEYLVTIGALAVVLVVWFFLRKRHVHKQPLNE